jgi:hypothetical protein
MIGYVQENNFEYWYDRINSWIDKLINNKSNNPKWNSEDKLIKDYENPIIAKYNSKHLRSKDGYINLVHLWVSLKSNKNICII